jgi:hypothetical protein
MENGKWKMVNGRNRPRRVFPFTIFHLPFSIILLGGCTPHRAVETKQPYAGPTEPIQYVVRAINENNSKLPTLWAHAGTMEVSIVDNQGKRQEHNFSGNVLYRSPRDVLVTGGHDLKPRILEIGSNRDLYWLTAKDPGPDTAWWGRYQFLGQPCVKPIPVRPDLVVQVLGISTINMDLMALPVPIMRFNNDRDEYMLTWTRPMPDQSRWVALKEVWYDRQTKRPTHVMLFDENGRVVLSAWLGRHKPVEVPDVPKDKWPSVAIDYRLYFPDSGSKLHLVLDDVRLNRKGAPGDASFRFSPDRAGVSKVIQLDEDCGP